MLKIGDKVRMTPRGFKFYADLDIQFRMGSVGGKMDAKHFTSKVCEQFAIRGIGVVKKFNTQGEACIRWSHSDSGIKYYYTHYFDKSSIKKLSLLDKVRIFLKGLL